MASRIPRSVLFLVIGLALFQGLLFVSVVGLLGGVGWWLWTTMPGVELASADLGQGQRQITWNASTSEQTLWVYYDVSDCTIEGVVGEHEVRIDQGSPRVDGKVHATYNPVSAPPNYSGHVRIEDFAPGAGEQRRADGELDCPGGRIHELRMYATDQH